MQGRSSVLAVLAALIATPAFAQSGGSAIPDPSGITLFGLGLAGVWVGRRFSRRPPED